MKSAGLSSLRLRLVTHADEHHLWNWANDPGVRAGAFQPDRVPWTDHQRWFAEKLKSPGTRIWILELDGQPVGQVRYDRNGPDQAEIDYSIDVDFRARGFAAAALQLTAPMAFQALDVAKVIGVVKLDNTPSLRAFRRAGFYREGTVVVQGLECARMVLSRNSSEKKET